MKILHLITGLSTGGAERVLFNIVSEGLSGDDEVAVVSLRDEGTYGPRIRSFGVPVYTLGVRRGVPGPFALATLRSVVRELRPQVIQGWMYHGNLAATIAARMAYGPKPAIAWNVRHSLYSLSEEKFLTRQVIRANRLASKGADSILYNSHLAREQHEAFGFAAEHGHVIPNGFDTTRLCPDPERARAVRRALEIPEGVNVIGHVARFHPMKDQASFLRAAVRVAEARPDVRFLVVGRDVTPENPALAGIVPPGLLDRFHFTGERSDVADLMQVMDVLCLSSQWGEAFPNVLGEAMATAVPCVATDVGDSAHIVGETGVIVRPADYESLFKGLMVMLNKPIEERNVLGHAARKRIEELFGIESVVQQYSNLYESLVTGENMQ